jgi:hypothetical protein
MNYPVYFLEQFIRELIINSAPTYVNKKFDEDMKEIRAVEYAIEHDIRKPMIIPPRTIRVREYEEDESFKNKVRNLVRRTKDVEKTQEIKDTLNFAGMEKSIMEHSGETFTPDRFMPKPDNKKEEKIPYMEPSKSDIFAPKKEYPNEGLYFGAIERLVKDMNVSRIECPGPDKYVSVKTSTKMMPTRTTLDKEDIEAIIDSFSRESRIPRIGGVFKAIVNNLIITAIDTDVGGPRFIITKVHPHQSVFL